MTARTIVGALLLAAAIGLTHGDAVSAGPEHESGRQVEPEERESEAQNIRARIALYFHQHGSPAPGASLSRLERAREEYSRRQGARGLAEKAEGLDRWVSLGPTNGAGRMTSIAPDPNTPDTVYAGAAGGGVWKTTDGGATWEPLTDDLPDLAVGALAVAPSSPGTIYVGTGEPNGMPGIGWLSSTDGGATWVLPTEVVANFFYRISVHPEHAGEIVAGTDAGGLRSNDGGATWTRFLQGAAVTDVVRSTQDPNVLYAAAAPTQVWRSEDGGATWSLRSDGIPAAGVRLALAISPSTPQLLYAACEISGVSHVYKTTDGGQSWVDLDAVRNDPDRGRYLGDVGFWANALTVVAGTPEVVVAGGLSLIRSADGGASWSAAADTHVDLHDLRGQGATLWIANDGGVWESPDAGASAFERNAGLVTRQYYTVAADPSLPDRLVAGAQDNGTSERRAGDGSRWGSLSSGDGFDCAIPPVATDVLFTSTQYGGIFRIAANAPQSVTPPYGEDEAIPFHTVVALDPREPGTIYTGSTRVWRSTSAGGAWAPLPTATSAGAWNAETVSTIAVAPSAPLVMMVGKGPDIYRTSDGGQTWTLSSGGLSGAAVNRVAIDHTDAAVAYAALAATDGASVYGTSDGGLHWEALSSGLPAAPALVVRVDPASPDSLYAGTEAGVFRSTDRGRSWSRVGTGLPATSVQDLVVRPDGSAVRIATYGRGVWELAVAPSGGPARQTPVLACAPGAPGCPPPREPRGIPTRP